MRFLERVLIARSLVFRICFSRIFLEVCLLFFFLVDILMRFHDVLERAFLILVTSFSAMVFRWILFLLRFQFSWNLKKDFILHVSVYYCMFWEIYIVFFGFGMVSIS